MVESGQRSVLVPYFRPGLTDAEIGEVVASLRSGWLTTGPRMCRFEESFAAAVGASRAGSAHRSRAERSSVGFRT
jgi:dTDP-4-amino-4,6-dideoxygalactose transaminase